MERTIWSSFYDEEKWRDAFKENCEINGIDEKDSDFYEFINDTLQFYYDENIADLAVPCGQILAIADLGLWDGRHAGYKVLKGGKVNSILRMGGDYNDAKFYCDQYHVKADLYHHDGVNHITFYEVRDGKDIDRLCDAILEGTADRKMIHRYCKSLRPKVAKVYGW